MFCSSCGKAIPPGALFCANCGEQVYAGEQPTQKSDATLSLGGKELTLSNGKLSGSYYTTRGVLIPMDNCINLPVSRIISIEIKERGWAWWEILMWIVLILLLWIIAIAICGAIIYMGRFKLIIKERNGNIITIPVLRNEVDKARAFVKAVENAKKQPLTILQQSRNTTTSQKPSCDMPTTADGRFIID